MIVVDASYLLSVILDENSPEKKIEAINVMNNHQLYAPSLLKLELVNTLLVKLRRKKHDLNFCRQSLHYINSIPINYVEIDHIISHEALFELAALYDLSSYDALYLKLALSMNIKLATNDKKMREAASLLNLNLF